MRFDVHVAAIREKPPHFRPLDVVTWCANDRKNPLCTSNPRSSHKNRIRYGWDTVGLKEQLPGTCCRKKNRIFVEEVLGSHFWVIVSFASATV